MIFFIFSSAGHLLYRSKMILAILVGSHLGNIPIKFESHWPKGSGGVAFSANYSRFSIFSSGGHFVHWSKKGFLFLALVAILFIRAEPF